GEDGHDLQCEVRRLLDEKEEAATIDANHLAVGACDHLCAARLIVDETELPEDVARLERFDGRAGDLNLDGALTHDVHAIAGRPRGADHVAGRVTNAAFFSEEERDLG